jgi:regulator of sigma E protease
MTAISFIIIFGLLVFFHEFGHFFVAKMNGVLIHEFSIGMGPKIFSKQGKETMYSLRAFPIGGYVKMEGENEASDNPRAFINKGLLGRFLIIFAGPFMNFVFAILLFTIIFMSIGVPTNVIDSVIDDYPAKEIGIASGDKIVSIDGNKVKSWTDVVDGINVIEEKGSFVIEREGEEITKEINVKIDEETGKKIIGIVPAYSRNIFLSVKFASLQVYELTTGIFDFIKGKIVGTNEVEGELIGPVGMVNLVGQAAKLGILNLIFLAAYFSLNLGFVNLLPLPALDGGRLIFIIIEFFRGKPVDQEKEGYVHFVGFVVLMAFMVFMIFRDIVSLR